MPMNAHLLPDNRPLAPMVNMRIAEASVIAKHMTRHADPQTMTFPITNHILPPRQKRPSGRAPIKYPFGRLRLGYSFFAPLAPKSFQTCSATYGHRHGMTLITRKTAEKGVPGFRVWRVA